MAKNYFKSYIWLLETLQDRGRLTLSELQRLWMRSSINDEYKELAPRTFANHVAAISDVFGIDIKCDRRDNTYYIDNEDEIGGNGIREWMISALSLNSLLNESAGMRDRIIFENVPSSQKHLSSVIQAIRDGKVIKVTYKSYRKDHSEELELEPYCLREFKKRWYLYAHKGEDSEPHMFALDRMSEVEVGTRSFKLPADFNAADYFSGIYGIRPYKDMKSERVILKVESMQAQYFRSLPLHHSQQEIETKDTFSIFSYYLTPDFDFRQDVLSFGAKVEVLEPAHLREEIKETISALNIIYD